ncbi:MAG: hypothetical protein WCG25_01330 [bacterium]
MEIFTQCCEAIDGNNQSTKEISLGVLEFINLFTSQLMRFMGCSS